MKSRHEFDASFSAILKNRILQAKNQQEEALFLLDTCLAACFFLAGAVERNMTTEKTIRVVVPRLAHIGKMIAQNQKQTGNGGHVEGDPEPYRPDDPHNRIIHP